MIIGTYMYVTKQNIRNESMLGSYSRTYPISGQKIGHECHIAYRDKQQMLLPPGPLENYPGQYVVSSLGTK